MIQTQDEALKNGGNSSTEGQGGAYIEGSPGGHGADIAPKEKCRLNKGLTSAIPEGYEHKVANCVAGPAAKGNREQKFDESELNQAIENNEIYPFAHRGKSMVHYKHKKRTAKDVNIIVLHGS